MADPVRQRQYEGKPNVIFDRRKDGWVRKIMVDTYGDDYVRRSRHGNPQKDVYKAESEDNPPNVWTFKRWCGGRAGEPHI
jgi:hypothetical protein